MRFDREHAVSGERRHIAIVLPNLIGGGAEHVQLLLAEEFVRADHKVTFVLRERRGELLPRAEAVGNVVSLDCARVRQVLLPLVGTLRRVQPDAVAAAMWPLTGLTGLANKMAGRPARLVVSEHTDLFAARSLKRAERIILRHFGRQIYGLADAVVAVSSGVADSLVDVAGLPRDRISVIYNPVRPDTDVAPKPADCPLLHWWRGGDGAIVAVGSLKPAKAYGDLVAAMEHLNTNHDYRLVIIGEGSERPRIEAAVAAAGLQDRVRLIGYRADPYTLLREADVFALSSHWEGLGNVLVEALSVGLRVVSTDCRSGPSEILSGGRYGRLVPVADPKALARAIHEARTGGFDRNAAIARAREFAPPIAARRYLDLLLGPQ